VSVSLLAEFEASRLINTHHSGWTFKTRYLRTGERDGLVDVYLSYTNSDDHWLAASPPLNPPFICLPNARHRTKCSYWSL